MWPQLQYVLQIVCLHVYKGCKCLVSVIALLFRDMLGSGCSGFDRGSPAHQHAGQRTFNACATAAFFSYWCICYPSLPRCTCIEH